MSDRQRWHRDLWAEAVWCSDLTPVQKLVGLAFADFARERDYAWVELGTLQSRTGLGRTAAASAVRTLVSRGLLTLLQAAAPNRSPRYRLVITGNGDTSRHRHGDTSRHRDPSTVSPGDLTVSPGDVTVSPGDTNHKPYLKPDRSSSAEATVIIEPADREPRSDDTLWEACRLSGTSWTPGEVASARRLLSKAFGDDARAAGAADAALKHLADRPPAAQVRSLGAFLRRLEQADDLSSLRVAELSDLPPAVQLGCPHCAGHPAGRGYVGDPDRPQACACRLAAQAARRSA